jgi:transcriptional regulator with XRE-family HTH domain
MSTLSDAIKTEFERILKERKLSVSAAAHELHVTRQAFHNYLNGKSLPRRKTLNRAIDRLGFKLDVNGMVVDRSSVPPQEQNIPQPKQLLLWESLDAIKQQDLKITVGREGSIFKVEVKIDIPA